MSQEIVFISGATSGIGKATAELLAKNGYKLILTGRRKERLVELENKLGAITEIKTLSFDITNNDELQKAFDSLPAEWKSIDILVNNAGNAHGLDPIQDGSIADWDAMIDINVKGLLHLSKLVMPGMVSRRKGHIVNIGSIAGKEVYPNGNVYCASKHAVDAITQGMRLDMNKYGIKVTGINPGLVETEFSEVRFKGNKERAESVYKGYSPLLPHDIAELIHFVITRPKHVNVADLLVLPTDQASSTVVNKNL
ncbi:SDR family NAD(P)-dependent oxidoreductase [Fulvivirga lutea]|uniref:SDR family NAD(P)-dependent oxidoreductase n=1 Tax=Fulvivirga lutea TaxID=2810512 RepID=A0A975A0W8_9BACT|nr:SDR family NAD(P)-dependent oxidoreductase [Fulvivirga lutea]QSE97671.1 SDR family NAD(P)-dependent oxidoreductase [Fulvivirga lutea]